MKNSLFLFALIFFLLLSCSTKKVVKDNVVARSSHEYPYNRSEWAHWSDSDGNCLDTRGEILKKRSLISVTLNKKGCKVKSGEWNDYYYPEILFQAAQVDIDHLIPLKHAHLVGAARWSSELKEAFANDPENLVITNRRYNRQKGAKGIHEWLPLNKSYACKYVQDWKKIKKKYALQIGAEENKTYSLLKADCGF